MKNNFYFASLAIIILAFLPSCIASKKSITKEKHENYTKVKVHNIELKEHQKNVVDYLLNNKEQKGLLLAHYLGTGKTYTALAYAEKSDYEEIIIFAPEFLQSNWLKHIEDMGIPNKTKYKFISFTDAKNLEETNLQKKLVIIDEIHRLVELIKIKSDLYAPVYHHLKQSDKILALSGTPIFNDISDLAYIINIVSMEDLLPLNERVFIDNYTKILKNRSFWRGHVTESHLLTFGLPFVLAAVPLAFITPSVALVSGIYFGGLGAGFLVFPTINWMLPLNKYPLRKFDGQKLSDVASKYISFYNFGLDTILNKEYPKKIIHEKSVPYNDRQIEFYLNFADKSLNSEEIKQLAKESSLNIKGDFVTESTALQNKMHGILESGREIGNLSFFDGEKEIFSPKFESIYETFGEDPSRIVVYSNYYENGILAFKHFLDFKSNKTIDTEILHPKDSVLEQKRKIKKFNDGLTQILLLHPNFTEGISLEGTSALHILEPMGSQAKYEQIIGRTVRLYSHKSLPTDLQKVEVYSWASTLSGLKAYMAKNNNWAKRFNELNSVASFGSGQSKIDSNFYKKALSPDEFSLQKRNLIKNSMSALTDLLEQYSIEKENGAK